MSNPVEYVDRMTGEKVTESVMGEGFVSPADGRLRLYLNADADSPFPLKIAFGISGGVDSAVAAMILKERGHDKIIGGGVIE